MTNIGPLTTTFTAPSSCATASGISQIWVAQSAYFYQQGPVLSGPSRTTSSSSSSSSDKTYRDCYPSSYVASASQYYSPGVCPSGYTPACSSTNIASATVTETEYTCCPTAYAFVCATGALASPYLGCALTVGVPWAVVDVTVVKDGSTSWISSTVEKSLPGLGALSVAVRFQSSDVTAFATPKTDARPASSTSSATTTNPIIVPAPTRQVDDAASSSTSSKKGVSTTTAIGIGIGSAVAGLLLAGSIALLLWIRRQRRRRNGQLSSQQASPPPPPPPPKDSKWSTRGRRGPFELDTSETQKKEYELCAGQVSPPLPTATSTTTSMMLGTAVADHGQDQDHGTDRDRDRRWSRGHGPDPNHPLRANPPLTQGSFWTPPQSYGFQPAELDSPPISSPRWTLRSFSDVFDAGPPEQRGDKNEMTKGRGELEGYPAALGLHTDIHELESVHMSIHSDVSPALPRRSTFRESYSNSLRRQQQQQQQQQQEQDQPQQQLGRDSSPPPKDVSAVRVIDGEDNERSSSTRTRSSMAHKSTTKLTVKSLSSETGRSARSRPVSLRSRFADCPTPHREDGDGGTG